MFSAGGIAMAILWSTQSSSSLNECASTVSSPIVHFPFHSNNKKKPHK